MAGPPPTPPAASLHGEHTIMATHVPSSCPTAISGGRFWRKAAVDQTSDSSGQHIKLVWIYWSAWGCVENVFYAAVGCADYTMTILA